MPCLPLVAVLAVLTIAAPMRLGRGAMRGLRLFGRRRLEPLEGLGRRREVGRKGGYCDPLARRAFDVAQIAALVCTAESNRDAGRSGARGAADAMAILPGPV